MKNKNIYYADLLHAANILKSGKYKNFNYLIISYGTHPCCYIEIPKGHNLYEKDYKDINIDCHGGLTYSDFRKFPNNEKAKYYIGWDYAHVGDFFFTSLLFSNPNINRYGNKKWTIEEMFNEIKHVIDQIKENE